MKSINRLVYSDDGWFDQKWLYKLGADKTYLLPRIVASFDVVTDTGITIGQVRGDILTIFEGYEWEGLTCWNDTAANMVGGLPHDFGYQLGGCSNSPFTRKEVDCWLRDLIFPRAPLEARITYAGVRAMGWRFYGKKSNIRIKLA